MTKDSNNINTISNNNNSNACNISSISGRARIDILNAAYKAGKNGAHIAPSLSDVDICLAVLSQMNKDTDSFILSKGHGALGYYAAMHQLGIITDEQFTSFEVNGGDFPGQPSRSQNNKIEFSSGSLGMGLSYALGVAVAKRATAGTVYVLVGDGELNEGSNWEAAALASRYDLNNLIVIVDNNELQSDGHCQNIMNQKLSALWNAYDWNVKHCDGHSITNLTDVISDVVNTTTSDVVNSDNIKATTKPTAIIAKTIKGKGVTFMENKNAWHHAILKDDDYTKALQEVEVAYGLL